MVEILIRRATPFDSKAIHRLMNSGDVPYYYGINPHSSQHEWQEYIERSAKDGYDILVADSAGLVKGLINISGRKEPAYKHSVMLSLAVLTEAQRQGTGRALMNSAISYAFDWLNASRIELEVMENNHKAINLYASCGFEVEGRKQQAIYRQGKYCDVLIMALLRWPALQT